MDLLLVMEISALKINQNLSQALPLRKQQQQQRQQQVSVVFQHTTYIHEGLQSQNPAKLLK